MASSSFARICSRNKDGLLENSKNKSVLRKSYTGLSGNWTFKYVDFPVFRGPHKNADCCGGKTIFNILG